MLNAPMVSVRIPSYNHAKYIHACIESVLNQTFTDFEVVIVDDCSTDNSVEVIRSFQDPRIKLDILPRNSGMNVAVERCMQLSSGKYVANLSSDDFWEPTKLEQQVAFLERHPEYDAVFAQVKVVGEDGEALKANQFVNPFDYENKSSEEWLRRFFYFGNCLCNPSVMIRRSVYETFGYQDKRLVSLSDFDLWVKFSFEHRFWILNQQLTMFRVRDNGMNLSANNPGNQRRQFFEFKQILDHYLTIHKTDLLKQIFPECTRFGEPDERTIPYFLGRLAIDYPSTAHWLWGCETIYHLLADQEIAAVLEKKYDFRYRDFLDLTKATDSPQITPGKEKNHAMYHALKQKIAKHFPALYPKLKRTYYKTFHRT